MLSDLEDGYYFVKYENNKGVLTESVLLLQNKKFLVPNGFPFLNKVEDDKIYACTPIGNFPKFHDYYFYHWRKNDTKIKF